MTSDSDLLQGYQRLLSLSNQMLKQARQGHWDDLVASEAAYVSSVKHVAHDRDTSALPAALRVQLRPMLKQVMDNELEIKQLMATRMEELRSLVQQTTQQQKVTNAYGRFSSQVLYPSDL
ncbi:flagella biosynthesis regulatory protein FliT [Pantoea dispersa]|uniref:Flagellar protein FliT n=1 Tax=Pantoea dispersa TaxID=59814 RepID=A0A8E1RW29_9GAMM|nr:flagella biosynthesis regulatory protein FliT [Pantoea dispersa]KTR88518.1 flagellar biosynthesis protein FliT [Pantoea dispersa]KTS23113.1 flagellar biosynthesis protein FliT [Pantoea dispersa]KTS58175.1 flagellar biosynthesis protein FliT [Pantoea dispersa]KTS66080.1 flagellar biosynthesis protein FliT [Pantoea dispersa]